MVIKTWATNEIFSCADFNYYARDRRHDCLCIARLGGMQQYVWHDNTAPIYFTSEDIDYEGMHSTTTSPQLFTPTSSGKYIATGFVSYTITSTAGVAPQPGTNCMTVFFYLNGATKAQSRIIDMQSGEANFIPITSVPMTCNGSSDSIQMMSWTNSGMNDTQIVDACIAIYRYRG